MAKRVTKQAYIDAVIQKLQDPKVDSALRYGPLGASTHTPLRDDLGMQVTFSNILQQAENLFDRCGGDVLAGALQTNFSQIGFGNVADVRTMGAIDVDILMLANSLVPFVAIDRAMADPIDTVWYSDLVLVDAYNDMAEGDTVVGNFQAPINVSTSLRAAAKLDNGSATLNLNGGSYVAGSVSAEVILEKDGVQVTAKGRDVAKDGNIYFTAINGVAPASGTITESGSNITIAITAGDGYTLISGGVSAIKDSMSNTSGDGIMKVRPEYKAVQLVSKPKQFIFQDNEATAMYMNRILARSAKVTGTASGQTLQFNRLANLYTEDVNRDLIRQLIWMSSNVEASTLNVGDYTIASSFAETKNDKISQMVIDTCSEFLTRNGVAPSVIVADSKISALLINMPVRFIAGPNAMSQLNGFIGTFNGIPVYRHNFIDQVYAGSTEGHFFLSAKTPDNQSGSIAFGEFLPLTKTAQALNFNNPMQNSTGWFAQTAVQTVSKGLVGHGIIEFAASDY